MAKLKRLGNFTASVLLVISLTFFNFSVPAVFAQDGDNSAAGVGNTDSGSNTQVATGDVNVVVDAGNEANTNTVSTNGNTESSGLTATPAPENDLNADSNLSASPSPSVSPEAMEDTVIPTPVPAPSPTPDLTSENASSGETAEEAPSPSPSPASTPMPAQEGSSVTESSDPAPSPIIVLLNGENSNNGSADPAPASSPDPVPSPSVTPDPSLAPTPDPTPVTDGIAPANRQDNGGITNNNEGSIGNNIAADGNSGDNAVANSQGDVTVETGNVNVVAGLVNAENTNITDSNLYQILMNIFDNSERDVNLSDKFGEPGTLDCPPGGECSKSLDVTNNNKGSINNVVLIDATSGNNHVSSANGNVTVRTGDANVAANIFNLLNTNITGSNWYNLIINIFGDWNGDLIMPGKAEMQNFTNPSGRGTCRGACGPSVSGVSTGQIENNIEIISNTGSNEASGDPAIIHTGDANSKTNLLNVVNTKLVGSNWFLMSVNNFGNWEGQVYSLPSEFKTIGDSGDIKIYNIALDDIAKKDSAETGDIADIAAGVHGKNRHSEDANTPDVVNNNTGEIKNSIIINILTGGNSADGSGSATIETGNANALASVTNILNSDITDGNWLTGMVNVFGHWKGNLVFGRPDLKIEASKSSLSERPQPDNLITYTLNYANNGDADATGVVVKSDFDKQYFKVTDPNGGTVSSDPGEIQWNIGNVPAGGTGSVSYTVAVGSEIPVGTSSSVSRNTIESTEKDWNAADNAGEISTEVYRGFSGWIAPDPNLQVTKTRIGEGPIYAGSNVDYEIVLLNDSDGSARNASVSDTLTDKWGQTLNAAKWDLGEVLPHEKITIKYTMELSPEIPVGSYTGTTEAEGYNYYWTLEKSQPLSSAIEISERPAEGTSGAGGSVSPEGSNLPEISPTPSVPPAEATPAPAGLDPEKIIRETKETGGSSGNVVKEEKNNSVAVNSQDSTIASSIKEIFGAEALAKGESDLSKKTEENNAAGGYLANIKYRDILAFFGFLAAILIVLYALPRRTKFKGIG